MGRLFWKIFLFTLVAQMLATAGIGGALWWKHRSDDARATEVDTSRMAGFLIESAGSTLRYGGAPALREMLANAPVPRPIFAVDEAGHELLGRSVNPTLLTEARALLGQQGQRQSVREIAAADGHRYLLFLPSAERVPGEWRRAHDFPPPSAAPGARPPDEAEGSMPRERFHHEHGPRPEGGPRAGPGPGPGPGPGMAPAFFLSTLTIATAVLGSLLIAALVAWYFSKPIRQLRSAFDAAAGGDLSRRAQVGDRRDELADLGRDFDRMTARLRELVEGQRRLLHDVSHEMRSPLARLQAAIGLARQRPEVLEASMARIERECERMDQLVGELLTLSRLEAGVNSMRHEDVDMDELLRGLAEDAQFEAQARGAAVELKGDAHATLRGAPDMLRRAIENVLRNAVRHTAQGSTVTLQVRQDAARGELALTISDHGPGVPEDELEAIFEPFVRGSGAAAAGHGHGLGLAIARRVVAAHGGSIRAFNCAADAGGGLAVEIVLPLKRA